MKNFNLSDIMIRAWGLYHTLTGDHRAKLSQALRMAWAEFKNPEPVQPAAPSEPCEFVDVTTIFFETGGNMTIDIREALANCNLQQLRKIFKLSKWSDERIDRSQQPTQAVNDLLSSTNWHINNIKTNPDSRRDIRFLNSYGCRTPRQLDSKLEKFAKFKAILTA